jgi:hypothetical protein
MRALDGRGCQSWRIMSAAAMDPRGAHQGGGHVALALTVEERAAATLSDRLIAFVAGRGGATLPLGPCDGRCQAVAAS